MCIRDRADVVGIYLADLGSPLGGPVLHALGQLVEAVRPVLDELGVVPPMLDDLVHERQREGGIGAGTGLQGHVRVLGHVLEAHVDDDELRDAGGLVLEHLLAPGGLHGLSLIHI